MPQETNPPFCPARVAILLPEKPGYGGVRGLEEDTVEAIAAPADGSILFLTGLRSRPSIREDRAS